MLLIHLIQCQKYKNDNCATAKMERLTWRKLVSDPLLGHARNINLCASSEWHCKTLSEMAPRENMIHSRFAQLCDLPLSISRTFHSITKQTRILLGPRKCRNFSCRRSFRGGLWEVEKKTCTVNFTYFLRLSRDSGLLTKNRILAVAEKMAGSFFNRTVTYWGLTVLT